MPETKISRHCPFCQASIRDQAFFCPQCGNKLDPPAGSQRPSEIHDTDEVIVDGSQTLTEADFRARNPAAPLVDEAQQSPKESARQRARGEVGSRIQKVTNKARKGEVIQRVQKFREVSNVVINEANYDPSLRFVLVAAALFVMFLVIVLLNKLIG
jgi:hypothetical protein